MVYPVVVGYTKGCRVVHPAWYCRAVVVYGCGLPEHRHRFTTAHSYDEIIDVSAGKHIQNCIKLITAAPPAAASQIEVAVV